MTFNRQSCSIFLVAAVLALPTAAQTYNANSGGYNTGYGTVYGSFGLAQATQQMYNSIQLNIQRSMMRQAMIKRHGLAAVEKAEREAASGTSSPKDNSPALVVAPKPCPKITVGFGPTQPSTPARLLPMPLERRRKKRPC